jgi:hypothetical protein
MSFFSLAQDLKLIMIILTTTPKTNKAPLQGIGKWERVRICLKLAPLRDFFGTARRIGYVPVPINPVTLSPRIEVCLICR